MTKEAKDNLNMFGRYAVAVAISFAVGRGWLTEAAGGAVGDFAVQLLGLIVAFAPAVYASVRIDNAPKAP